MFLLKHYRREEEHYQQLEQPDPRAVSEFQRLNSLKSLVTMGSNIPLYRMGYDERVGIRKPCADFQWHNFYSQFDIVGYPLGAYYTAPADRAGVIDRRILTGGIWKAWNWWSHETYWSNGKVIDHTVEVIKSQLARE